jgi:predicted amidophosphoribosyltransferase
VVKIKKTLGLKDISDFAERMRLLEGAFQVDRAKVEGKRVLLLDDLYDSSATMNTVASALKQSGKAAAVYALAITRTRTLR